MIIFKSFFRKKTTKFYILIFFFIFLAFNLLMIGRSYYIYKANDNYSGSFAFFEKKRSTEISAIKEINNYKKGIKINDTEYIIFDNNYNLKNYEMIVPDNIENPNRNMNLIFPFIQEKIKVVDTYHSDISFSFYIVNEDTFNNLISNVDVITYFFTIENWYNKDKILDKISEKVNAEIISYINEKQEIDYTKIVNMFIIFIYIIIFLFIILSLITLFNTVNDEKKIAYLYRTMGYSRNKVIILMIIKIISLLSIAMITSFLLSCFIKFFFKL